MEKLVLAPSKANTVKRAHNVFFISRMMRQRMPFSIKVPILCPAYRSLEIAI
jgi:hypothetical protein